MLLCFTAVECHLPYGITEALPTIWHKWTHPTLAISKQAGTRFTCPREMEGCVNPSDWLHTETIYPPTDGHPFKY